ERRKVGDYAVERLGAATMPAKPRDHFVEDQDGALRVAAGPESLEKARAGLLRSGGLEDEGGDLAGIPPEERVDAVQIVVAERQGHRADALRDARRHGRRPDEPVVGREERLVAADGDEIAAGVGPGELDRGGR